MAQFIRDTIYCDCGKKINVNSLISDITSDANTYDGESKGEETFVCESCEREHWLSIEVSVEITVESSELETINPYTEYHDKEGNILKVSYFEKLKIGDKTPELEDGQYTIETISYVFDVTDGEVKNKFSSTIDENQLTLFEV